jgi:hypothetical protein
VIDGEMILGGSGVERMFGRSGDRVRKVRPRASVRSDGGSWSPSPPGRGVSGSTASGCVPFGDARRALGVNQSSCSGSGRTCARFLDGALPIREMVAARHDCGCRIRWRVEDEATVDARERRMGTGVIDPVCSWS